jgi:hypothetical protein
MSPLGLHRYSERKTMITKAELTSKCRDLYVGKDFVLNNGATVTIPSMPIGALAAKFIRMQEALGESEFVGEGDEKVKNEKWVDPLSVKGMEFFGKMLHAILALNYDVSLEESQGLFSMQQFNEIVAWFYTGQDDIEARLMSASPSDPTTTPSTESATAAIPGEEVLG